MDDGRNRLSHDTGCIVAGASFFATFFPRGKKVDLSRFSYLIELVAARFKSGGTVGVTRNVFAAIYASVI